MFVGDKTECCKDSFTLPSSGVGPVVRILGTVTGSSSQPSPSTTSSSTGPVSSTTKPSSSNSTSGSTKIAAIVGGVLGAALLAALVALVVLILSNRRLRRQAIGSQPPMSYPPASHYPGAVNGGYMVSLSSAKPEMPTPTTYINQTEISNGRQELAGGNHPRPVELGTNNWAVTAIN